MAKLNWDKARLHGRPTESIKRSEMHLTEDDRSALVQFGRDELIRRGNANLYGDVRDVAKALKPGQKFSRDEAFRYLFNLRRYGRAPQH